jgi:hypothetical protein
MLMAGAASAAPPALGNTPPSSWVIPLVPATTSGWNPWPIDSSGYPYFDCVAGCSGGGGGGGTVTQGPQAGGASGNTWFTQDVALDALISGGKLPVLNTEPYTLNGDGGVPSHVTNWPSSQAVTGTFWQATQPVSGTFWQATQPVSAASLPLPTGAATSANQSATLAPVSPAAATATNSTLMGCQGASTQPTFTAGQQGYVPCDLSGGIYVHPAGGSLLVYAGATSSSGPSWAHYINSASSAMATNVKSSGGNVYRIQACNSNASVAYFHLYNTSSAPTVGATSQLVETIIVPATGCITSASYADVGGTLGTGISFDVTTGSLADADTTTITTANTVAVTVYYK